MNTTTIKLLAAILVLLAALLFLTKDQWFPPLHEWYATDFRHVTEVAPPPIPETGLKADQDYVVKRVQVLKGDQFDIVLDNDSRILARLKVRAIESSKPRVVDLLNSCENPKVRLVQKHEDGQWLVDIRVMQNGKEVDIATWLSDNKLVYK